MSEDNQTSNMTVLDEVLADGNLQMLKAALPYVSPQGQRFLSIFAKVSELQKTMSLFQNSEGEMTAMSTDTYSPEPLEMLNEIRQYAAPEMQANIDQMINIFGTMKLLQVYHND